MCRLFCAIILCFTCKDSSVLNPFWGYSTTSVAAMGNERKFLCTEKDKSCYDVSISRAASLSKCVNVSSERGCSGTGVKRSVRKLLKKGRKEDVMMENADVKRISVDQTLHLAQRKETRWMLKNRTELLLASKLRGRLSKTHQVR